MELITSYPFINNIFENIKKYFILFSNIRDGTSSSFSYNLIQTRVKKCEKQLDLVIIKDNELFKLWNEIKKLPFGNMEYVVDKLSILYDLDVRDEDLDTLRLIKLYGFILLFSNFANYILSISQQLDNSIEYWRKRKTRYYWYLYEKSPVYIYRVFFHEVNPMKETIRHLYILKRLKDRLNYFMGGFNLIIGIKPLDDRNLYFQLFQLWNQFNSDLNDVEAITEEDYSSDEESQLIYKQSSQLLSKFTESEQFELNILNVKDIVYSIEDTKKVINRVLFNHGPSSFFERNWITMTCITWFSIYAFKRYDYYMKLARKYLKISTNAVLRFSHEHLFEPLKNIIRIIRYDDESNLEALKSSIEGNTEALVRMVYDYAKDKNIPDDQISSIIQQSEQNNINYIMQMYEKEVRKPIRNALLGDLMRLVLIQVQKQKVDVEKVMMNINVLIKQNEINFQIMAVFPAFILSFIIYKYLTKKRSPQRYHYSIRYYVRSISVLVNRSKGKTGEYNISFEDYGQLLIYLHRLYGYCFKMKDSLEKYMFFDDLKEIETEHFDSNQRLTTLQRMSMSYGFLKGEDVF